MTVIELQPGGGWYTEILAPVLYAHGHLLEASGPKFAEKIKSNPAVFGHIGPIIPFDPPKQVQKIGDRTNIHFGIILFMSQALPAPLPVCDQSP